MQLLLIALATLALEIAFTRRLPKITAGDLTFALIGIAGFLPGFTIWPVMQLNGPFGAVAALVVWSFLDYWAHRALHWGPFWLLHRMHHSAEAMSPLVRFRGNPGEQLFTALWPMAIFGMSPWVALGLSFYQCLVHCDVAWTWGWFGRWIVVPPLAHRVHHSAVHKDVNFGTLAVWDHVFGTYCEPVMCPVGVPEATHGRQMILLDCVADVHLFLRYLRDRSTIKPRLVG